MAKPYVTMNRSGLYEDPREDWLALHQEDIIDPARPIVDPHHHLWDRDGQHYLLNDIVGNVAHLKGRSCFSPRNV